MEELSRAELSALIRKEAARLVTGTAFLFILAGSVWTHFGLGPVILEAALVGAWFVIHVLGFATLRLPRLQAFSVTAGLLALQAYFYLLLKVYQAPFLPLAPVFFVVSALTLIGFVSGSWLRAAGVWTVAWTSSYLWLAVVSPNGAQIEKAVAFAVSLNGLFLGGFLAAGTYFGIRLARQIALLGPRGQFDEQRLQASKLQVIGELTTSLSHEMNNPLTAIAGYNYQIREEIRENPNSPAPEILRTASERIKFNLDRITEITRTLRSFARDSNGDDLKPVSLRAVIADTMTLMRHHVRSAGVELALDCPSDDFYVKGNFVQIGQVLVNLLGNARDAVSDRDRRKVTLGCGPSSSNPQELLVWVEDTGPGIPEAVGARLFQPFYTTKGQGKGTGLGLYISRMIAERHQGRLEWKTLKDSTGRVLGTRFTLALCRTATPVAEGGERQAA